MDKQEWEAERDRAWKKIEDLRKEFENNHGDEDALHRAIADALSKGYILKTQFGLVKAEYRE
ncbi:hypothetical protein JW930_04510 [Candidatus Woesearchaeota archaeon]|nr:hypothetical protein [Candidatus Woesearchaeota archaeon]